MRLRIVYKLLTSDAHRGVSMSYLLLSQEPGYYIRSTCDAFNQKKQECMAFNLII